MKLFRVLSFVFVLLIVACTAGRATLPDKLSAYIKEIVPANAGAAPAVVSHRKISRNLFYVSVVWDLKTPVAQDDLQVKILPAFRPVFNWAPHLTPDDHHVIAQHVFRAPALIVADSNKVLSVIPDLDILKERTPVPWYMDMDAVQNYLVIGMGNTSVKEHVLFVKKQGAVFPAGKITMGFYCIVSDAKAGIQNPFHRTTVFMWNKWASGLYRAGDPLHQRNLEPYVKQTYDWAFKNWKQEVWQQFELNGKTVGAPVFIVNTTQSPNYKGQVNEREFRSIWNQAWFNSLRSAQGLYRYAVRTKNDNLKQYALKTKELALAFPQTNGFFKSIIATEMEEAEIEGRKYHRSKGWGTKYFGNSNRNPYTWDPRKSPYHIADMSFTAYWMLVWYKDLEKDGRLLSYAMKYADALIELQDSEGFFPAWLTLESLMPMDQLKKSPETSVSATLLLKLYELTKDRRYLRSAEKAMRVVIEKIVPAGQWEDFETYWSCSRVGSDSWVGKKIARNNMFKQNSFSVYWTAEALLEMYKVTGSKFYLKWGQRTLDELLMFQAVWQPPFIAVRSLGGFGVMNADGEWNDSRQSLFAGLIIEYGKLLKQNAYVQRGIAALRASFTMMYTPLNPATMKQWQARWPFFGEKDYGFMMENYGHEGITDEKGLGIGEFTIYDWGNGSAAEAYNRLVDKYGEDFFRE